MPEKVKGKLIMSSLLKKKVTPFPKKKVVTSEKVTTSEEVDKGTNILDDMEEAVVTIRGKDLDHFQGQSKGATGWFNNYYDLRKTFSTLELNFYKNFLKRILKVKI